MPVVRWKDRVKEHIHERVVDRGGGIDLAGRECVDMGRWKLFCRGHRLGICSWKERGVRDYINR